MPYTDWIRSLSGRMRPILRRRFFTCVSTVRPLTTRWSSYRRSSRSSRLNTWPGMAASTDSSRNSTGVSSSGLPSSHAAWRTVSIHSPSGGGDTSAGFSSTASATAFCCGLTASASVRRSTARTRATISRGLKGLQM